MASYKLRQRHLKIRSRRPAAILAECPERGMAIRLSQACMSADGTASCRPPMLLLQLLHQAVQQALALAVDLLVPRKGGKEVPVLSAIEIVQQLLRLYL